MKKLTITVDEQVYDDLYSVVGKRNISQFINTLVKQHVAKTDLDAEYKQMAEDEEREAEAFEWIEACVGDVSDETR